MYLTVPHRKKEIEQYCNINGIELRKTVENTFEPDEIWRTDND